MNVLVFEDESLSAQRLCGLITKIDPQITVIEVIESVSKGLQWLSVHSMPDLIFMDIHLSDGDAFELFDAIKIASPIIFTTAFDDYAIKAFKVNSIDYLLKPIDVDELQTAILKFKTLRQDFVNISAFVDEYRQKTLRQFKMRFLVKFADQLKYISIEEIAYFRSEGDFVVAITHNKYNYSIDSTLEQLEKQIDPILFQRINRKYIISLKAIDSIHNHFNGRLKIHLKPIDNDDVLVSRERVVAFKAWLDL